MSTLEDLVGLLSLPPKQLAHVHADVWTSQLPRAALSAAAHAASFSKATAGTAATAADAMHSNAQAAQAALARLVRQLNALLQAKSAFSQSLAIFLVGRLATAAADTSLSSSCPAWFQATLNVALRVKDEATLANAFTTLSELVPLSKHNPELRKVLQSSIKRLMDLIADALIHSKTSILHVANLLTSLSVYYAPTPATKREAFATIMVQQLLDLSRRPDKLHLKAVTRCLRAMLSGLDNRSVESGTPFAAMQTRLIGTLAFLLNGMQPSDKDTGDASRNDVETLRFDEHYGAILFPGADPSIMSLAAYVTAFERVAIVLRHLISAYAPGYRFELEVSRLLAIFDRAYEAIENANAWNGLAKLVPGSSCILANVCNDLLLVCLTV
ncbi:hypothetical protein BC831DRAFT_236515 [Entophlyctis helioformis]|nr:hypothetical protein BC831DRAFT_236515 [Entophlyctis helioformis]